MIARSALDLLARAARAARTTDDRRRLASPRACARAGARPSAARSRWSSRACPSTATQARSLLAALRVPEPTRRCASASRECPAWASRRSSRPSARRLTGGGPPGRCAGRRPEQPAHRRLGARVTRPGCRRLADRPRRLHPGQPECRHARWRGPRDQPGDARARGGGVRRGAGRDRRRRPVRDHRGRHGRHLPLPDPGPHRRPAPGHQARASSSSPTWSRSTRPTATTETEARVAARELGGRVAHGPRPRRARPPWSPARP